MSLPAEDGEALLFQFGPSYARALTEKYATMLELIARRAHDAEDRPNDVLRKLAERFPGALRELDAFPLQVLRERHLGAVNAEAGAELSSLLAWIARYHGWMRLLLYVKSSLARPAQAGVGHVLQPFAAEKGMPTWDAANKRLIEVVRNPPLGRLNELAFSVVAREFDVRPEVVEVSCFGRTRTCSSGR